MSYYFITTPQKNRLRPPAAGFLGLGLQIRVFMGLGLSSLRQLLAIEALLAFTSCLHLEIQPQFMLQLDAVLSYILSRRQLSSILVLMEAAIGPPLERQPELMQQSEAVFSFLSSWRQKSAIVTLFITASSFCLIRQQEIMLQLEALCF